MMFRYILACWFAFSSTVAFGANIRWIAAAQDVSALYSIDLTGTWAPGDTATLTINNKNLIVTAGASVSTTNIADTIARAIDASNDTEDLLDNEERNFGGEEIPEFAELDAYNESNVLFIKGPPGVPVTITKSYSTAGNGQLGADEVQTVTITGTPTGGTFTLTYSGSTTANIAYNADAATVDAALEALGNIGAGDVTCTGGALPGTAVTVTFTGALAATNVAVMTADGALLTGGSSPAVTIATTTQGGWTEVTAATGKHFLNNTANYSSGTVPVDNDVLIFENGSTSVLYELDHFRDNAIDLDVTVYPTYTGRFGLPPQNTNGYVEYRERWFEYQGGSKDLHIRANGPFYVDMTDQTDADVLVSTPSGTPTTNLYMAGAPEADDLGDIIIETGVVEIEPDQASTLSNRYFRCDSVLVGKPGGAVQSAVVTIGKNARAHLFGTATVQSGTLIFMAPTLSGADITPVTIKGGSCYLRNTGTCSTFDVWKGGTLFPEGYGTNTIGKIQLLGGTLDARRATDSQPSSDINAYAGAAVYDPNGMISSVIDFVGCKPSDCTLDLPTNRQLDFSATAVP